MATAAAANESRSDLLSWLNDLLQLNVTKIESVGTGAVLCQIMDSIYGDVHMHKVKFNTHQEYEYVNNFKVLQACFNAHGIDKFIPVERLIKLKFQDNLEFLQWMKKFWDSNYPGGRYDALARRKGVPAPESCSTTATRPTSSSSSLKSGAARPIASLAAANANAPISKSYSASVVRSSVATAASATPPQTPGGSTATTVSNLQHTITQLNRSITELRMTVDELEKERDFYFNKLRDIEIATQQVSEKAVLDSELFRVVTETLYKTEEGFEIPEASETTQLAA